MSLSQGQPCNPSQMYWPAADVGRPPFWGAGGGACRDREVKSRSFGQLLPGSVFVHGILPTVGKQGERPAAALTGLTSAFMFLGADLWSESHQSPGGTRLQDMGTLFLVSTDRQQLSLFKT